MRKELRSIRVYSPYGYIPIVGRAGEIGFNGQWLEPLAEGYMLGNGYRQYRPSLMRFLSPDSFSPFGEGGLNTYSYCSGDPVNNVDPTGRMIRYYFPRSAARAPKALKEPEVLPAIVRQLGRGKRAVGNSYFSASEIAIEGRLDMPERSADIFHEGVLIELRQHKKLKVIGINKNFENYANLPKSFILGKVLELIDARRPILVAKHGESNYYFTHSERGLNLRNQAEWAEHIMSELENSASAGTTVPDIRGQT